MNMEANTAGGECGPLGDLESLRLFGIQGVELTVFLIIAQKPDVSRETSGFRWCYGISVATKDRGCTELDGGAMNNE